jgi:hypothetical protein
MTAVRLKEKSFLISLVMGCVVAALITLSLSSLYKIRANHWNEARIKSKSQAQLLAQNASAQMVAVDLVLLSICSMIQKEGGITETAAAFTKLELGFLSQIRHLALLDAAGKTVFGSVDSKDIHPTTFEAHRDAWLDFSVDTVPVPGEGLYIQLSRRIEDEAGLFLGAALAVVDPRFFYERFNDYLNIDVDAIALFDMTGRVLALWSREEDGESALGGATLQTLPFFSSLSASMLSGGGRRLMEGEQGIVSTHQLSGFPFQVAVFYSRKGIQQRWVQEAGLDIATILAVGLVAVVMAALAYRHRQRRRRAEEELFQYQAHLEEMVEKRTQELAESNRELLQKNKALEEALSEVKTLSGLLPFCSHCKKIRDDQGYWSRIETYMHHHSGVQFSHGICPECAKKFYPEFCKD